MAALCWSVTAFAEAPVGAVASLEGRAEALHAGATAWADLAAGGDILLGDQIRTAAEAKLELVFNDDSVLTLGPNSQLTVTEQVAGPAVAPSARFSLVGGAVQALVTDRYAKPGARFEVETPTAIAGVRGTGFVATYDAAAEETVVVGLFDTTLVRARIDATAAHEVRLGPGEMTRVRRGGYPLSPARAPETMLRGLTAATGVRRGGSDPGAPKQPQSGESQLPEGKAIDQPVDVIKGAGGKPPPPPPPLR